LAGHIPAFKEFQMSLIKKTTVGILATVVSLSQLPSFAEAASRSYCNSYARKEANHAAGLQQVLPGAAVGAVGGALLGAIVGGHHAVGTGAILGGVGGTVVGGTMANKRWHGVYDRAYARCRAW
jgi:uncharacterized protein YcfJ